MRLAQRLWRLFRYAPSLALARVLASLDQKASEDALKYVTKCREDWSQKELELQTALRVAEADSIHWQTLYERLMILVKTEGELVYSTLQHYSDIMNGTKGRG